MQRHGSKVCLSLHADTLEALEQKIAAYVERVSLIELRLDYISEPLDALADFVRRTSRSYPGCRFLITLRSPSEGGQRTGLTFEERKNFWKNGFEGVLLDLESELSDLGLSGNSVVFSSHNLSDSELPDTNERWVRAEGK